MRLVPCSHLAGKINVVVACLNNRTTNGPACPRETQRKKQNGNIQCHSPEKGSTRKDKKLVHFSVRREIQRKNRDWRKDESLTRDEQRIIYKSRLQKTHHGRMTKLCWEVLCFFFTFCSFFHEFLFKKKTN